MKNIFTVIFLTLLHFGISTQIAIAQHTVFSCGTDATDIKSYPNARIMQNECALLPSNNITDTIPVVVHVIYTNPVVGSGDNISKQQILETIARMNDDFKNNTGKGADAHLYFVLARSNPNGESTDGINRVDGRGLAGYVQYGASYNILPGASYDSVKALSIWPNTNYVNIWCVTRIAGSFAGTALTDPMSPTEGVVIASAYFNKNEKTVSHEMGHFWNLRHVFNGETTSGCPPNDDCTAQGDGICDTPPIRHDDYVSTSCLNNSSYNVSNSIKNYMSYNYSDSCDRFTAGQVTVMRAMLLNRLWLLQSSGLISPVTPIEIRVVSMENESTESICNSFIPKVIIENLGATTINTMSFDVYINDVKKTTVMLSSMNLLPHSIDTFSLPLVVVNLGLQNIKCVAVGFNGQSSDYLTQNNIACTEINFETAYFLISAQTPANGNITGSGGYACNDQVNLAALPNSGYTFKKWYKNDVAQNWMSTHSFNATENITVSAEFMEIATGLNSNAKTQKTFAIFPNPVYDILQIKLDNKIIGTSIEIFDILGQMVYSNTINPLEHLITINTNSFSSGQYFIKVQTKSSTEIQQFLKN